MARSRLTLLVVTLGALTACSAEGGRARAAPPPSAEPTPAAPPGCLAGETRAVGQRTLRGLDGEANVTFVAGLAIDADGAPNAYHPGGLGLDHLANAGRPGSWWGLVVDAQGQPVVQGAGDPAPGYYVSRTSLEDRSRPETDPRRYVDAAEVPYIVMPGGQDNRGWLRARGVSLGDLVVVHNVRTGRTVFAIWADNGPAAHLGEGSVALASALGYDNASPRNGGSDAAENIFLVLGGTSEGWPRPGSIDMDAGARFEAWGGIERLRRCEAPAG